MDTGINELIYKFIIYNDPDFKGAVQVFKDLLHFQAKDTNGTFLKRILKQRVCAEMLVWYFRPNDNKLINFIDQKLQQLLVGGLIDHYDAEYKELINPKRYKHLQDITGPKVLTMKHLRAGFNVWLISVISAILVFMCEWIIRTKCDERNSD